MLGEKLGEFQGKITGQRILPADSAHPKTETSFEISGTILGIEVTMMGTYWSTVRSDGLLYGECPMQGILLTRDGAVGTWTAAGVGRFTGQGSAVSFRGAVYFQTVPPSWPASRKSPCCMSGKLMRTGTHAPRFGNGNRGSLQGSGMSCTICIHIQAVSDARRV